ncbi:hypothetical protein [Terricaulis sp.]|uniref:hypothetical protein n=1 Tax=Terricaulis sp. TaxID=2768686 RepID=UPI002AC53907|nr:hypothetical protein [Terricaulis sp.]MDZ4691106.1 hypothetical protein [Terricaulis sp.]
MRLVRLIAVGACAVSMLACTEAVDPPPDPEAAAQIGEAQPLPDTLPPPSASQPRYVGLWATSAEGCAEPAWRFQERQITTLGEVACSFNDVRQTNTGYEIAATCTAEGPPTPHTINLSFAESARAMMISGGPWQQGTSLVYCAPL